MSSILWGLIPDRATGVRVLRGLLLGAINGALPLLTVDGEISARRLAIGALAGALGMLAGYLRAGEPNQPAGGAS